MTAALDNWLRRTGGNSTRDISRESLMREAWTAALLHAAKLLEAKANRYIDNGAIENADVLREAEIEIRNEASNDR